MRRGRKKKIERINPDFRKGPGGLYFGGPPRRRKKYRREVRNRGKNGKASAGKRQPDGKSAKDCQNQRPAREKRKDKSLKLTATCRLLRTKIELRKHLQVKNLSLECICTHKFLIPDASSSFDEAVCEEQELVSFKLLQTKQNVVPLGTSEKSQLNALLQLLWNGEIAASSLEEILPLISKIAKDNLNFPGEKAESGKKWDKNNDGKKDNVELRKPSLEIDAKTAEGLGDAPYDSSLAPVDSHEETEVPSDCSDVERRKGSLIQANTTRGEWAWMTPGGAAIEK